MLTQYSKTKHFYGISLSFFLYTISIEYHLNPWPVCEFNSFNSIRTHRKWAALIASRFTCEDSIMTNFMNHSENAQLQCFVLNFDNYGAPPSTLMTYPTKNLHLCYNVPIYTNYEGGSSMPVWLNDCVIQWFLSLVLEEPFSAIFLSFSFGLINRPLLILQSRRIRITVITMLRLRNIFYLIFWLEM